MLSFMIALIGEAVGGLFTKCECGKCGWIMCVDSKEINMARVSVTTC